MATIAVFVPAGVLCYSVGHVWEKLRGNPWREQRLLFARPDARRLDLGRRRRLANGALDGWVTIAFALVATVLMLRTNLNQALMVLVAGAIGAFALH